RHRLIVTDPPYYDDVPYAELSEFFYVWERRVLSAFFPEVFNTSKVDTGDEISVGGDRSPKLFYARLKEAFVNMYSALEDDGLLVLFFAHKSLDVWEEVVDMLSDVGFHITSATPLSTESVANLVARNKRSVYYSLVLTARKRVGGRMNTLSGIRGEIGREIERSLGKVTKLDYRAGELYLWSVGVALRVITGYSKVASFGSESVGATALRYAQEVLVKLLLASDMVKVLGRRVNVDRDTSFYLSVLKDKGVELDSDDLNMYVKSLGLDEEAIFGKKLVVKVGSGKSGGGNRTIYRLNDAFSRASVFGVSGEDVIEGSAQIDWVHRAIIDYSKKNQLGVVEEYARKAGVSVQDFLGVIKMVNYYRHFKVAGGVGDEEYRVTSKILDAYEKFGASGSLDRWMPSGG
ncbi:MAG: hypothetical protein QW429_04715, partial [Thermoprotei archaeon]